MAGSEVRAVVRDVVADVAPEELPLVTAMDGLDDATVVRRLGRRCGRREPLGFGLGEVVVLATPVVWLALDQVTRRIADSAADGAVKGLKAVLRRIFRRTAPRVVPALTPEQLGQVRRRVLEVAAQRSLDDDRATRIADAVVARLSLGDAGADVTEPSGSFGPEGESTGQGQAP